ncbi:uncharacterized protein LOC134217855 isoform X3 [Armigeres subalbatus]|uniref:uncharacterized protein LOC134217855 isoform X3 n=1 Tax=Armigeres subalbatus TaxID=124917 RepID=UPI002ED37D7D
MSLTVRNLSPFSGICALLWMLGIAASVEAVAESLDPEETSFVFTRSIEQHAGGIESDGDIRVERILNWTRWEFSELAVDQKTSCFVRDLLSRLKLLDVDSGRFQIEQLWVQYRQYKEFLNCTEDEVSKLADNLEQHTDMGECDAVFYAFRESILPSVDILRKLFLLDTESSSKLYTWTAN